MIKFQDITLQNFLSVGDNPITIKLDDVPTTLVTGVNGSGKSGIICDGITFALFGKSYRGVNKPKLINNINNKGALVTLNFKVGRRKYTIKRGMKPTVFEILESGKTRDKEASAIDQQKWLEEHLLKFNHKAFVQTVLMGSMDYTPFMELAAQPRRDVIENLLDISVFSDMRKILRARISDLKEEFTDIDHKIDLTKNSINAKERLISKMKESTGSHIDDKKEQLATLKERAQELKDKKETLENEIAEFDIDEERSRKDTVNQEIKELERRKTQCQSHIQEREKLITFFDENDECPTCDQHIDPDHKQQKRDLASEEKERLNRVREKADTKLSEKEVTRQKLSERIEQQKQIVSEYDRVVETFQSLVNEGKELAKKIKELTESKQEYTSDEELKLVELQSTLASYEERKEALDKKKRVFELSQTLLKDNGIKASIISQYLPVLNRQANHYLNLLGFNIQFHLDEEFNETLKYRFQDDVTYKDLSMGERQRLNLALTFAWRDVAKMKNSANTNLIIFDELFDSSIDAEGTKDLMNILRDFRDTTHLFVISHREGLEHLFEKHMHFVNKAGFTSIQ